MCHVIFRQFLNNINNLYHDKSDHIFRHASNFIRQFEQVTSNNIFNNFFKIQLWFLHKNFPRIFGAMKMRTKTPDGQTYTRHREFFTLKIIPREFFSAQEIHLAWFGELITKEQMPI